VANKIITWNNEINSYVSNEIKPDIMQKIEKNKINIIEKNEELRIINLFNVFNFENCHLKKKWNLLYEWNENKKVIFDAQKYQFKMENEFI